MTTKTTVIVVHCWSAPRSRSTALLYSFFSRRRRRRRATNNSSGSGAADSDYCDVNDDDDDDEYEEGDLLDALDEPLYREWLLHPRIKKSCGAIGKRPYSDELNDESWREWSKPLGERIDEVLRKAFVGEGEGEGKVDGAVATKTQQQKTYVIFCKHMAKHAFLYDFHNEYSPTDPQLASQNVTVRHVHLLLIRNPTSVLTSWSNSSHVHHKSSVGGEGADKDDNDDNEDEEENDDDDGVTPDEIGMTTLLEIRSTLLSRRSCGGGASTVVIDSDAIASNPVRSLTNLCHALGLPYDAAMLQWEPGPKECDGPWAHHWYHNVHKSCGWGTSTYYNNKKYKTFKPSWLPTLRLSLPAYEALRKFDCSSSSSGPSGGRAAAEWMDLRNAHVICYVGRPPPRHTSSDGDIAATAVDLTSTGLFVPRDLARISPFDSVVQGGDAVWETLIITKGCILNFHEHLVRLFQSAKAMGFYESGIRDDDNDGHFDGEKGDDVHTCEEVKEAVFRTLAMNGMRDNAHVRVTLTRGVLLFLLG